MTQQTISVSGFPKQHGSTGCCIIMVMFTPPQLGHYTCAARVGIQLVLHKDTSNYCVSVAMVMPLYGGPWPASDLDESRVHRSERNVPAGEMNCIDT